MGLKTKCWSSLLYVHKFRQKEAYLYGYEYDFLTIDIFQWDFETTMRICDIMKLALLLSIWFLTLISFIQGRRYPYELYSSLRNERSSVKANAIDIINQLFPNRRLRDSQGRMCLKRLCGRGTCCGGKRCCKKGWSCRYMSNIRFYTCIP